MPLSPAYGVYVSQLIQYARACFAYEDFSKRSRLLTNKLMLQGYRESHLESSFRKFYGRYYDLVCNCRLSLAHVLNNLFHTICWTVVPMLALATGDPVCLVSTGGARAGVTGRQRMLAPPRHLILPSHLSVRVALHSIL
jgi:hypothetical protein